MSDHPARQHPNIVHGGDVPPMTNQQGDFELAARRLGTAAKNIALGVALVEVPPGKTAFPNHYHSAIEEGIYILAGEATARIGKDSIAVAAGDYIGYPPGPDHAHQLTNTGSEPLRYLALSAPAVHLGMDIVGYPDSEKIAFMSGVKPGGIGWRDGAWVMKLIKSSAPDVGYFDDEPLAKK